MRIKLCVILLLASGISIVRADEDPVPEPTQKTDVAFRLFRSKNLYNFLRLDTRNGMVWQVQWGEDSQYRWIAPINLLPLADSKELGRFTLVPTRNIFNFLLVDQHDGRVWQVQWSGDKQSERFITSVSTELIPTAEKNP